MTIIIFLASPFLFYSNLFAFPGFSGCCLLSTILTLSSIAYLYRYPDMIFNLWQDYNELNDDELEWEEFYQFLSWYSLNS